MSKTTPNKGFSVIMSLYYKEKPYYLVKALSSIWEQQTLKPNEIILIIDGKITEELEEIVSRYKDIIGDSLIIERLPKNVGLASALNIAIKLSRFDYIARMDTDDISEPDRFNKQFSYLIKNPDISVLGSYAITITENDEKKKLLKVPIEDNEIRKLVWTCPFIHPTVMLKKDKIIEVGGYNPNAGPRQDDYDLWFRCAFAQLQFANLEEPLLLYRFTEDNVKKNSIKVGWYRFKIGVKGNRKLGFGLKSYIGVSVPFIRALMPYPLNVYFYKFASKFNPRTK